MSNRKVVRLTWTTLLVVFLTGLTFNKFAYEIEEFNANFRSFIATGKFASRFFDDDGIPVSIDPKSGRAFVSPFYVVHYGLMHSDGDGLDPNDLLWKRDPSIELWNVPPKHKSTKQFLVNAEWVLNNIKEKQGKYHLFYDFDWAYRNYPNSGLKAPWWSGLTDSYAIILMLRAHEKTRNHNYLEAAIHLYETTLTPIAEGGSLAQLNGEPWIEEYVDSRASEDRMSKVLNGMIYAYHGIKIFEAKIPRNFNMADKLRRSIIDNIELFSLGNWSWYDLIKNPANLKYHRIHGALLGSEDFDTSEVRQIRKSWDYGTRNMGYYWMTSPGWSYAKTHFLLTYIVINGVFFGVILRLSSHNE